MTDTKDLIREIQEHTAAHGGENTATHLLVQAVMALQRQADEMAAIGAGGVSGPLLGGPPGSGGWQSHAEAMERERDHYRQRAQTMHEHQQGQAWYWQGDADDHLESLVNSLPVVIRADQLRALVAQAPQQAAPAGPSYTVEEMRRARRESYEQGAASTVPQKVTPAMRAAFREAYKNGSMWTDRLDRAVEAMIAAAPQQQEVQYDHGPQAEAVAEAARDVGKWLNERPNRPLDLRHVAMLAHHATAQPAPQQEVQEPVRTSGRNCYLCGHPAEAHPMGPDPRGGMRRGSCPMTAAQPAPSGDAAIEEVIQDANRYRWLRRPLLHAGQGSIVVTMDDRANGKIDRVIYLEALDAAIDAARKEGK